MRTRSFLAICAVLAGLLVAAGAVYAYDAGRDDLIADGVRIGGIDVGGLRAHQARERLAERILRPLDEPVVARYKDRRYRLTSERARVGVDIEGSVQAALQRSRDGSLFARAYRALAGEPVDADVSIRISHDESAVRRFVRRISRDLAIVPRDAEVRIGATGVDKVASRTGREVVALRLRRQVTSELTSLDSDRRVRVRARSLRPGVTTSELAERYPAIVIVNRSAFRLTLYERLKPAKTYRIAVGKAGMDTPAGRYAIQNKAENPAWHVPDSEWAGKLAGKVIPPDDPRNPIEARWMGIYNGAGIHGTEAVGSLGTRASHGCIRMAIPDVIELYDRVPVGSPVYIA